MTTTGPPAVVAGPQVDGIDRVFAPQVLEVLGELHRRFDGRRRELLAARAERQCEADETGRLDLLEETRAIREDDGWRVRPAPADLADRRVEITGPTEPKMSVNALNSGAKVWLARAAGTSTNIT